MIGVASLVGLLWAIYLSECFVRWRPGDWIFRQDASGAILGVTAPDVTFVRDRFGFVWTSFLPWQPAYRFSGEHLGRRKAAVRVKRFQQEASVLKVATTILFALVMVAFPLLVLTERLLPWLPLFSGCLIVTWLGTLAAYLSGYRRLYGHAPKAESWLPLSLSPVSLIRAVSSLSLNLSPTTHPLVGAAVLCPQGEFLRIARLWQFDADELRPTILTLVAERRITVELTAPPTHVEEGASLFCPRCHTTFMSGAQQCVDCGAVRLNPLPIAFTLEGTSHVVSR